MKKILLFLILLIVTACHKKPTEPIPPVPSPVVTGTWSGSGIKNNIQYTILVDLSENNKQVIGSGSISAAFITISYTVAGSNEYPKVSLNMANSDSSFTGNFIGEFVKDNDNKMVGLVDVPAFQIEDEPLTMNRIK